LGYLYVRFAGICKAPSRLLSIIGMLLVTITISQIHLAVVCPTELLT